MSIQNGSESNPPKLAFSSMSYPPHLVGALAAVSVEVLHVVQLNFPNVGPATKLQVGVDVAPFGFATDIVVAAE